MSSNNAYISPDQQRFIEPPSTTNSANTNNTTSQHHSNILNSPTHSISNNTTNTSSSSNNNNSTSITFESPLPPVVQRCLGDRSYDKRKNAALEIEALIKSLSEANNSTMIQAVISVLSKDFSTSMNANYRKGGLIGIAATAIGLMHATKFYLDSLLPPVLHCFDDPESRVRYYACESLYNIAKVARVSILRHFSSIFDGLCKLYADVDVDVKNGAGLLDRLIKDIVTESETFKVEQFIPVLQNYIKRTNPYIRQLLLGWITALDSVPDINMVDYLPDFLDGLFNMLGDCNREIRRAADSALSEFLREVRQSSVVECGPMISILVNQCHSKERLNRLTAISWVAELIHLGGDAVLPYHAEILSAIMRCISDGEVEIRKVAERTNDDLLVLVKETAKSFELSPLLQTLTSELMTKEDVPTKMAASRWINMLLEKRPRDMNQFISDLLPVLLRTLSDLSDDVVLLNLQVLSRIALVHEEDKGDSSSSKSKKEGQFQMVLNAILNLFASNRRLLETRGSLIIRKLCVLLNAENVYICLADSLSSYESTLYPITSTSEQPQHTPNSTYGDFSLEFIGTMVQTLNLILLTAAELHGLRSILSKTFKHISDNDNEDSKKHQIFYSLFHCWCHSPASTFAFCLLAQAYSIANRLISKFSQLDVSVGFLMQLDKLVQLLESPVFVHLRLQLLDVESPHHTSLLKSCYGLLMLLPQSDSFKIWNDRLTTVCNLRDSLNTPVPPSSKITSEEIPLLDSYKLLDRFDKVMEIHKQVRNTVRQLSVPELYRNALDGVQSKNSVAVSPIRNNSVMSTFSVVKKEPSSPGGRSTAASSVDSSVSGSDFSRGSGVVMEKSFVARGSGGMDSSLKMKKGWT